MHYAASVVCCLVLVTVGCTSATKYATCAVAPNSATPDIADQVKGTVSFQQEDNSDIVSVSIDLEGFSKDNAYNVHGFHVHATGDISGGCGSAGGHFNPDSNDHAGPADKVRHVGDLGNINEDASGRVKTTITDNIISLKDGKSQIIGKAIVVHEKDDDLGQGGDAESKITGNAGSRLACCVIMESSGSASAYSSVNAVLALTVALFSLWVRK